MSIICYYIRTDHAALEVLTLNPEAIFGDLADLPQASEVIDVDKAYDALSWLVSPLKRAEAAHMARLIGDPDWPDEAVQDSVARLNSMDVDDALVAIEGQNKERLDDIDLGLGGAVIFWPDRVRELALALSKLDEDPIRRDVDFALMDEHDVQPAGWLQEGEEILESYVLPTLRRLKAFYAAASELNQLVLLVKG